MIQKKTKKIFENISFSLILSVLLVLAFLFLANDQLQISIPLQKSLSFNLFNAPLNALYFLFVHAGVGHLVANVLLVFFMGRIIEKIISRKHIIGIFFGVGVLSFVFFNFASPQVFGIGASGGAIALTAVALMLSPKKSVIALVVVFLISLVFAIGLTQVQVNLDKDLNEQHQKIKTELNQATIEKNQETVQIKERELQEVSEKIEEKKENREYEKNIRIANSVHFISSILAMGYLFIFCRKITQKAVTHNTQAIKKLFSRKKE